MRKTTNKSNLLVPIWEYLIPLLAIASLTLSCIIISRKKFFWNDELYSYYFLSDPSFSHMMVAFHDKINNTPPLYFLLGWLWARLFGSTELSLRLFSCLGMCIACVIVWITLRRTYNFWSANIGTLSIFCTSELILAQNAEARMYGLFLAVCALALLHYNSINEYRKITWRQLLPNIFVHAAIVNTHLYGLFYSGAVAIALIVQDRYFKIFRPKVYLSFILAWLSLLVYIPSFINQSDAGTPRTWIPIPNLRYLIDVLSCSLLSFQGITIYSLIKSALMLLLILISTLPFIIQIMKKYRCSWLEQYNIENQNIDRTISLFIFAYFWLVIPILVWIFSKTVKPIFWDRYLIPTIISWSIIFAYLFSLILFNHQIIQEISKKLKISSLFISRLKIFFSLALTVIFIIQPINYARSINAQELPGLNDNKYGYENLPIVAEFSHDFLIRFHYPKQWYKYFFLLDWQIASDLTSGLFPPEEYKHLEAWKRSYPKLFHNNIIKSQDFLSINKRFLFLTLTNYHQKCSEEKKLENFYCPRFLEMKIMNNAHYKIRLLGQVDNREIFLIENNN